MRDLIGWFSVLRGLRNRTTMFIRRIMTIINVILCRRMTVIDEIAKLDVWEGGYPSHGIDNIFFNVISEIRLFCSVLFRRESNNLRLSNDHDSYFSFI